MKNKLLFFSLILLLITPVFADNFVDKLGNNIKSFSNSFYGRGDNLITGNQVAATSFVSSVILQPSGPTVLQSNVCPTGYEARGQIAACKFSCTDNLNKPIYCSETTCTGKQTLCIKKSTVERPLTDVILTSQGGTPTQQAFCPETPKYSIQGQIADCRQEYNGCYGEQLLCSIDEDNKAKILDVYVTTLGAHTSAGDYLLSPEAGCSAGYRRRGISEDCGGQNCLGNQYLCVKQESTLQTTSDLIVEKAYFFKASDLIAKTPISSAELNQEIITEIVVKNIGDVFPAATSGQQSLKQTVIIKKDNVIIKSEEKFLSISLFEKDRAVISYIPSPPFPPVSPFKLNQNGEYTIEVFIDSDDIIKNEFSEGNNKNNPNENKVSVGTAPQTCNPNWQCSSWGACSSTGTETRTCNDLNNCGVNTGKPTLSQSCVPTTTTPGQQRPHIPEINKLSCIQNCWTDDISCRENNNCFGYTREKRMCKASCRSETRTCVRACRGRF